jgi:ABC-type spermidine/putrescine transport system permease subunit I
MMQASAQRGFWPFLLPVCALMLFGLVMPLAFILTQSFSRGVGAYGELATSRLFTRVTWTTFEIAVSATLLAMAIAYPIALHLSRLSERTRPLFMTLVLLPFWTSILVKSYAFIVVLGDQGLLNGALASLGLPRLPLMFNRAGVLIGMTNFLVPFVVFPLLANLLAQDGNLRRAASVMGASDTVIFWKVTFPLSLPALAAGGIMCFVLSLGFFITPALLGGRQDMMIANLIDFYTRETLDWPAAAAISMILLAISLVLLWLLGRLGGKERAGLLT